MALYRKYRPASFGEVVGQEHVTTPLSAALDSGRINHAYLFSGPRGCGKTSSARIMARSLNCVDGPTSTPCGKCPSCVSLAPGGPGNLDVTELDAASHRGVDDMRDLRDRAFYAPADSRYRVFIIDEAHMITNEGFNALLKIVEEPPEHLIFIFATTEPDKVIPTIRSRTHHYPFRLLTPPDMRGLLQRTCEAEGVRVDDAVFPLIIRAGGGSPRDSLSILDQLLAGAGEEGLSYEMAVPLLGVTDFSLIDAAVAALSARDYAGMFGAINDVINAGHDPRRFATDLLDRLRDLMVLQVVPDAVAAGLIDVPEDYVPTLQQQAQAFAPGTLSWLAGELNSGIDDLKGATSPRLLLEVLFAKMLAGKSAAVAAVGNAAGAAGATAQAATTPASGASAPGGSATGAAGAGPGAIPDNMPGAAILRRRMGLAEPAQQEQPAQKQPPAKPAPERMPAEKQAEQVQPEQSQSAEDLLQTLNTKWAHIRSLISNKNAVAGILLAEAKIVGINGDTVLIGNNTGALVQRLNAPSNNDVIAEVVSAELGQQVSVECVVGTHPRQAGGDSAPQPAAQPARTQQSPQAEQPAEKPAEKSEEKPEEKPSGGQTTAAQWAAPVAKPSKAEQPEAQDNLPRWKQAAARGNAKLRNQQTFGDGVPLPPEPDDPYGYPPDESMPGGFNTPAQPKAAASNPQVEAQPNPRDVNTPQPDAAPNDAPTQPHTNPADPRDSEEEELIREAQGTGSYDRRDAKAVAMDLLAQELGARPL
ncbi:DNA polymerase III subunit gamma and tau [Corynebacterium argentoratense]|uniref:DNA polymerase III subunit gamma and tau n=1 Tax=Corynebacterium argentoratense TaxID=42817 RepID=UPI001F22573C|nr:DNA polymerase III subunit gamma and tau [Corynebacterium argentoratense]MCF1766029.1 DNA polymerase III subunit gamma and tau [Corynebacterium argentoratense]